MTCLVVVADKQDFTLHVRYVKLKGEKRGWHVWLLWQTARLHFTC